MPARGRRTGPETLGYPIAALQVLKLEQPDDAVVSFMRLGATLTAPDAFCDRVRALSATPAMLSEERRTAVRAALGNWARRRSDCCRGCSRSDR